MFKNEVFIVKKFFEIKSKFQFLKMLKKNSMYSKKIFLELPQPKKFNGSKIRVPFHNPETFESNIPNLYIAGVIAAGLNTSKLFIENTRHHGDIIVQDILSKKK